METWKRRDNQCRVKSQFVPVINDPILNTFEILVLRDLERHEKSLQLKRNISKDEFLALRGLANDDSLIRQIKKEP